MLYFYRLSNSANNDTVPGDDIDSLGTVTLHVVLITVALLLGVTCVANLYTWGRVFASIVFSQRTHLRKTISKLDTLKSEGFQQALSHEVALMKDMVKYVPLSNASIYISTF